MLFVVPFTAVSLNNPAAISGCVGFGFGVGVGVGFGEGLGAGVGVGEGLGVGFGLVQVQQRSSKRIVFASMPCNTAKYSPVAVWRITALPVESPSKLRLANVHPSSRPIQSSPILKSLIRSAPASVVPPVPFPKKNMSLPVPPNKVSVPHHIIGFARIDRVEPPIAMQQIVPPATKNTVIPAIAK
jgi:hypothetical protein